jgi:transposase
MAYSSDLKPQEYELIQPYLPKKLQTKKREISYHSILNGMFYQLKNGCTWRDLPKDLPKWQTVYYYFNTWKEEGRWGLILEELAKKNRIKVGKKN